MSSANTRPGLHAFIELLGTSGNVKYNGVSNIVLPEDIDPVLKNCTALRVLVGWLEKKEFG